MWFTSLFGHFCVWPFLHLRFALGFESPSAGPRCQGRAGNPRWDGRVVDWTWTELNMAKHPLNQSMKRHIAPPFPFTTPLHALLTLLGLRGQQVPFTIWSPAKCSFWGDHLSRSGSICFCDPDLDDESNVSWYVEICRMYRCCSYALEFSFFQGAWTWMRGACPSQGNLIIDL